ncbi:MmcQ/YjbR family DNA-binding protein [Ideonella sp. BN130291]|uniref:MmcQ/YjbR family DNA-binding protein n=1 Tax=Ideonella sp. BN130291 TaxID=3112940 RepID=UPI002E25BFA3|nr:MmcQ/YjbR family DNA-binding protein [Ideonella sp. BN130291]
MPAERLLARLRRFALALPEVTEEPHFDYASWRVRGKIFVTVPPDGQHMHVFAAEPHREPALAMHPHFLEKLTWGSKVVGLRVDLRQADPSVVEPLVLHAWEAKAPKRLVNQRTQR